VVALVRGSETTLSATTGGVFGPAPARKCRDGPIFVPARRLRFREECWHATKVLSFAASSTSQSLPDNARDTPCIVSLGTYPTI